ncbi:MAG: L-threonylcarbamoyladenylate synthase [Candidatus Nealsonbacteria bacterium]
MKVIKGDKKEIIIESIRVIEGGGVVVFPTDTVYGLLVDAENKKAVEKVFEIKKRLKEKTLPVFVKDIKTVEDLCFIDEEQKLFLKKVWPGKVTMILKLKTKNNLVKEVIEKNKTIGLRIPKYKLLNELLKKINKPLTATSANISGKSNSNKIKKIIKQFSKQKIQPDLIVDVGNLKKSKPSTIIYLTRDKIEILRKGDYFKF